MFFRFEFRLIFMYKAQSTKLPHPFVFSDSRLEWGSQLKLLEKKIVWAKSRRKHALSSGVVTTFLCEQVTNDVASFRVLLYQRRSQRHPKQKRDPLSTECIHGPQNKQT